MVSKAVEVLPQGCKMKGKGYCPRPLECAADFLSKKWTLSILITVGNFESLRFNHIQARVQWQTKRERIEEKISR